MLFYHTKHVLKRQRGGDSSDEDSSDEDNSDDGGEDMETEDWERCEIKYLSQIDFSWLQLWSEPFAVLVT